MPGAVRLVRALLGVLAQGTSGRRGDRAHRGRHRGAGDRRPVRVLQPSREETRGAGRAPRTGRKPSLLLQLRRRCGCGGGGRRGVGQRLLDVGDDPTACWLSCLCTFCVFGWNMERLGMGNARLHAVMFALLCFAPLWVLSAAAVNIQDEDVRYAVGVAGVVLCALGLLYGGFWRARMRRKYGLPGTDNACCSAASPWLPDYLRWLFCWSCALAQEVRTANLLLDVEAGGGGVHRRDSDDGGRVDAGALALQPLPRENGVKSSSQRGSSHHLATIDTEVRQANYSTYRGDESPLLRPEQESSSWGEMTPPVPPSIPEGERR